MYFLDQTSFLCKKIEKKCPYTALHTIGNIFCCTALQTIKKMLYWTELQNQRTSTYVMPIGTVYLFFTCCEPVSMKSFCVISPACHGWPKGKILSLSLWLINLAINKTTASTYFDNQVLHREPNHLCLKTLIYFKQF